MLYLRHPSSLEHDPTVLSPEHPDTPERVGAIESAMAASGWLGCDVRQAPAATERSHHAGADHGTADSIRPEPFADAVAASYRSGHRASTDVHRAGPA